MTIKRDCYVCIYTQALNVTKRLKLDEETSSEILRGAAKILSNYDLSVMPPEIAKEVYEFIEETLNIKDPFENEKKEAIKKALELKSFLEKN